jgi:carbamoyltransferase
MYILGLSFYYHDSAAALIHDGVVVAASAEERFSRVKHDSRFPQLAIDFCLKRAGISIQDVEHSVCC